MEKVVLRLKELRGEESQAKFAARLELPQQTYSRYESGKSEPPLALLKDIALKFGVSADWLLGLADARPAAGPAAADGAGAWREAALASRRKLDKVNEALGKIIEGTKALQEAVK